MKKIVITTVIMLLMHSAVFGQLSTREEPISFSRTDIPALETSRAVKSFAQLDMEQIMQEDIEREKLGMPPRFGYKHSVNYNLENSGEWITLPDGGRIWRLAISSQGALSINLLYDKFWIPDGAKFWIYSYNRKQSIGAFTSKNNRGTKETPGKFATGLIFSGKIMLEYYLPKGVDETGNISISYVVHGYRHIALFDNADSDCYININCSFGLHWQAEKNAVALILVGNAWLCTGFLINNTANDGHPFFMTAEHCLRIGGNPSQWLFVWHYEMPGCENVTPPIAPTLSGARLIASSFVYDFALLELKEDPRLPNSGITPYYLGWDRMTINPGGGGIGIHHPGGNVKKISRADKVQTHYIGYGDMPADALWAVNFVEGAVSVGSSGSPLLIDNYRVIGHLIGIIPARCATTAYYGKFDVAWRGSVYPYPLAIRERRLGYWLDPLGTNPMFLDGIGIPSLPIYIFGSDVVCCDGSDFILRNPPQGAITWSVTAPFSISSTTGNSTRVTKTGTGTANGVLIARVNNIEAARRTITPCQAVYFTNRTVRADYTVTGCGDGDIIVRDVIVTDGAALTLNAVRNIYISNVTIAENSRLILSAGNEVVFDGYFEVHLGAEFEMR